MRGKYLSVDGDYVKSGIFEDAPTNSHFHFDMVVSYSTLLLRYGNNNPEWRPSEDSWQVDDYYTYVLLNVCQVHKNISIIATPLRMSKFLLLTSLYIIICYARFSMYSNTFCIFTRLQFLYNYITIVVYAFAYVQFFVLDVLFLYYYLLCTCVNEL